MAEMLLASETEELARCEEVIGRGMQTFIEVGTALMTIRNDRLYRQTHSLFEDYCRERWQMVASRARQYIAAVETVQALESVTNVTPTCEGQIRPLARLEPAQQREAWQEAVASSNGHPTAKHVEAAAEKVAPRPDRKMKSIPVHAELFVEDDETEQAVVESSNPDQPEPDGDEDEPEDPTDYPETKPPILVAPAPVQGAPGADEWARIMTNYADLSNSVRRRRGMKVLARSWPEEKLELAEEACDRVITTFEYYKAEIQEVRKCRDNA